MCGAGKFKRGKGKKEHLEVIRAASCWSDHNMVRMNVRTGLTRQQRRKVVTQPNYGHQPHRNTTGEAGGGINQVIIL